MIKLPNLDDRYFDAIVKQARSMIPKLYPEWTDENTHDPGITLMELFAWYAELQQYYADQVTGAIEEKFLAILGVRLQEERTSAVNVTFGPVDARMTVPSGTPLSGGGIPFELLKPAQLLPFSIDRVLVHSGPDVADVSAANRNRGVFFDAFGRYAAQGSQLWLGFAEPLPAGEPVHIYFQVSDRYPVPANPFSDNDRIWPSVALEVRYFAVPENEEADAASANTSGNTSGVWQTGRLLSDETHQFTYSGSLTLELPQPMVATAVRGANDLKRYWIYLEVKEGRFEVPPKLETIVLNTAKAVQQKTYVKELRFGHDGDAEPVIALDEYLARYGHVEVQVYETLDDGAEGWIGWQAVDGLTGCGPQERAYKLNRGHAEEPVLIQFGDSIHGALPPTGEGKIRVVLSDPAFRETRPFATANGMPGQTVEIPWEGLRQGSFSLQVSSIHPEGLELWQDFRCVPNFHASSPDDCHFIYDVAGRLIRFADDINGRIPAAGMDDNIRVLQLVCGGGSYGNITKEVIDSIESADDTLASVPVTNYDYAHGGQNRETLQEAKDRFLTEFHHGRHAVTAADLERLVMQTPGLRIARVKAIPLYKPGTRNYPVNKAAAQVTVVVVPYSEEAKPHVSAGFLQTVRHHLEQYRLLTTEMHVIAPEYFRITVHANLVVKPHYKNRSEDAVTALNQVLQPFDRHQRSGGWPFGKAVTKSDVLDLLNRISGVLYVQDLRLEADGTGYTREPSGDIRIPPHGLVYGGLHQIHLISTTDL